MQVLNNSVLQLGHVSGLSSLVVEPPSDARIQPRFHDKLKSFVVRILVKDGLSRVTSIQCVIKLTGNI